MTNRENFIKTVLFQDPQWIPAEVHINLATWDAYGKDLERVALKYPEFFPYVTEGFMDYDNIQFPPAYRVNEEYVDAWGCTWVSPMNGIEGVVTKHPLDDLAKLKDYKFPDPETTGDRWVFDWPEIRRQIAKDRADGKLTAGGLMHGFLFLRMQYLCGFENAMIDLLNEEPELLSLMDRLQEYNMHIVRRYAEANVDLIEFPEDLGTQTGLIISPDLFRRHILPRYAQMYGYCRDRGIIVSSHSDGYIMEIAEDLIGAGLQIINPQDLCNGIDDIAKNLKGRACIKVDIDRQSVIPYGSRKDIFDLIEEEVRKLGSVNGGLTFIAGIYPPTPPENVDALCAALKKFRHYYWE